MGEGEKRRSRRAARYDSRELAVLSRKQTPSETEWDENIASAGAKGSIPPQLTRTTTVDDPFTTSLLAEIARRSKTIDVSPDQIDEVTELKSGEPGPSEVERNLDSTTPT